MASSTTSGAQHKRSKTTHHRRTHATPTTDDSAARIVVAADNADLRDHLWRLLSERYTVESRPNGAAALAAVQRQPPALVLADEMMPVLDGFGLLRALRADLHTRAIPVILLMAQAGEDATVAGLEAGADDCVQQPFSARELLSRISVRLEITALQNKVLARANVLEAAFDAVTDSLGVFDAEGRVIQENAAQRKMRSLIIPSGADTIREHAKQVPLLDTQGCPIPEVKWPYKRILSGEVLSGADAVEIMQPTPDGENAYFSVAGGPLRDTVGRIIGAVCVTRDVTERRRLERELRKSEQRYRALVETSSLIVWTNDPSGTIKDRIPMWETITGLAPEEYLPGDSWVNALHPDDQERMAQIAQHEFRFEMPFEVEYRVRDEKGTYRWILSRMAPVRDESGVVREWIGAATDIHERKAAEETLRRAHEELERRVAERTTELTQVNQSLRALSQRILDIQERERRRVARELHDEIGQALTGVKMMVEMAVQRQAASGPSPQLEAVADVIDDALARVRDLALDLRPAILDNLGLLPALLWHFERFTKQSGIQVEFRHSLLNRRFAPDLEIAVFRLVQEALTNVARHAGIQTAMVQVLVSPDMLAVYISDQGRGFDVEAAQATNMSSGLASMRERIALLGGALAIASSPGHGTTITAGFPLTYANATSVTAD